jgi:hypothetical protein
MAKSAKKAVKKAAKKSLRKIERKAASRAAKKTAKKAVKKAVKKVSRKAKAKPVARPGKRFLVIYHVPMDERTLNMDRTPEDHAEGLAIWKAWAQRCGERLLDLGAPLANGKSIASGGSAEPSEKEVAGFSLLLAEDWDEVLSMLEGHPHISGWHPEATIEVHETMMMPGL